MLKQIFTGLAVATMAISTFAQSNPETPSVSTVPLSSVAASKGFRVALVKPFLDIKMEVETPGVRLTREDNLEKEMGLSLGYAYLPLNKIGFIANGSFLNMDNSYGKTVHMFRLDGNLAYAFNNYLYLKGGLNISNFTDDELEDLSPGAGLQLGAGMQITKNFGLDVSYVMMQQHAKYRAYLGPFVSEVEVNQNQRGLELALHATF